MDTNEKIGISGYVRLQLKDSEGNVLMDTGFQKNGIPNTALAAISGLVGNTGSQTSFNYLAVGTGATAFAASQTTLITEVINHGLVRTTATITRSTTTQTNDTLQLDYTWTASGGSSDTIAEIGVFNASSVGIMLARKVVSPAITVGSGQLLQATYKVIFS